MHAPSQTATRGLHLDSLCMRAPCVPRDPTDTAAQGPGTYLYPCHEYISHPRIVEEKVQLRAMQLMLTAEAASETAATTDCLNLMHSMLYAICLPARARQRPTSTLVVQRHIQCALLLLQLQQCARSQVFVALCCLSLRVMLHGVDRMVKVPADVRQERMP